MKWTHSVILRALILCSVTGAVLLMSPVQREVTAYSASGAGYRVIDGEEPGGPLFSWDNVSGGTLVSNWVWDYDNDDGWAGPIFIGFPFPFFQDTYDSLYIDTNGLVSFVRPSTSDYTNDQIPIMGVPNTMIAVFWDDLAPPGGTDNTFTVRYRNLGNRFVIQWTNVSHWPDEFDDRYTFQVALYAGGAIRMQYQSMSDGGTVGTEDYPSGDSATIGIEDQSGATGLLYNYENVVPSGGTNNTYNGLAVGFLPGAGNPPWPTVGGSSSTSSTSTSSTSSSSSGGVDPGFDGSNNSASGADSGEGANGDNWICSAGAPGTPFLPVAAALLMLTLLAGLRRAVLRRPWAG